MDSKDVEQQWNDDPAEEAAAVADSTKKKGCRGTLAWAALALIVILVAVIVPVAVTTAKKKNQGEASQQTSSTSGGNSEPTDESPIDSAGASTSEPTASLTCSATTDLVCPANTNTTDWFQVANNIVGEAEGDIAGFQISMSCDGSIVAIGSDKNDGNGNSAGHVRIFRYNNDSWEQMGKDLDGESELDAFGYSVSLAASGLRVAVGGRYHNGANGNNTGHVQIYDYVDSSWTQIGDDIEGEADGDQSGRSVSLSADGMRVAVGASANDATATNAGHVRVYELDGSTWTQLGNGINGQAQEDYFGRSVSLSGDGTQVAIGAYKNDNGGEDAGHVRIYKLEDNDWIQMGGDIEGTEEGDWVGLTLDLSLDGNRVVVGAPGSNDRFLPGVSMVYEFDGSEWTQLGGNLGGGFTVSLSEDGNRVAVGDYKGFSGGINAGHVNVYEYDGSDWNLMGSEITGVERELSGTSVALSADGLRVAISSPAYKDDDLGEEVGVTKIYDLC